MYAAEIVKLLVLNDFGQEGGLDQSYSVMIGAFANCREQGYSLAFDHYVAPGPIYHLQASFATDRHSDQVVVYFDKVHTMNGMPSDEGYKRAVRFDDPRDAAAAIIERVRDMK
jgi:hypothetical protein